jgi:hypothetical protein
LATRKDIQTIHSRFFPRPGNPSGQGEVSPYEMNEETKKQTMTFRLSGGDSQVTPAWQTKRKNQGRFPMKNALIIALATVLLPINITLADTSKEPAIEQTVTTKTTHPAKLSLPGIVIEEFDDLPKNPHAKLTDWLNQRIVRDFKAMLDRRLAIQERSLLKAFDSGQDVRLSSTTARGSSGKGS